MNKMHIEANHPVTDMRDREPRKAVPWTKTPEQADGVLTAWNAAVDQARTKGTLPPGPLPDGLSAQLNPGNLKAVTEADAIDPLALATTIPDGTPVLLTCSDSDGQARCTDIKPLADALAHTQLTFLQLKGVNHVLRDDPTDNLAKYATPGPLSPPTITQWMPLKSSSPKSSNSGSIDRNRTAAGDSRRA